MITQLEDTKDGIYSYHNYKAESKEEAIQFLTEIEIKEGLVYYYVDLPNGTAIGKDCLGLFEDTGDLIIPITPSKTTFVIIKQVI